MVVPASPVPAKHEHPVPHVPPVDAMAVAHSAQRRVVLADAALRRPAREQPRAVHHERRCVRVRGVALQARVPARRRREHVAEDVARERRLRERPGLGPVDAAAGDGHEVAAGGHGV